MADSADHPEKLPVLLIPGGAATARDYYPLVPQALAGHPIVTVDRPGTGTATGAGQATLPGGAQAWAAALRAVSDQPAMVVGQSLGGAVAVQFALDYPALTAGLVLLDPTPFGSPRVATIARSVLAVFGLAGRLPLLGPRIDRALWQQMARDVRGMPEVSRHSFDMLRSSATVAQTATAIRTLKADGAALTPRLRRLDVPVVLVTADRKPGHTVRREHEALATTLGARLETWPGCVHAMHLLSPECVAQIVLEVVAEAQGAR